MGVPAAAAVPLPVTAEAAAPFWPSPRRSLSPPMSPAARPCPSLREPIQPGPWPSCGPARSSVILLQHFEDRRCCLSPSSPSRVHRSTVVQIQTKPDQKIIFVIFEFTYSRFFFCSVPGEPRYAYSLVPEPSDQEQCAFKIEVFFLFVSLPSK